jgi:hypothetical protein
MLIYPELLKPFLCLKVYWLCLHLHIVKLLFIKALSNLLSILYNMPKIS